ncbi:sortase [Longispora fulva]|uniref:Sortase (Surface protein transpeptidase) n=1 Tax=Longispora fulva TaxID=619741 RepID=A0A8J7GH30_9ACTN|nr:sortase [Longispora fulva]MBG6137425.1 sortase (surface protein transpeptidase) [Longispora fulva]GIG61220.1 sortase [Longispora fulva]
MTTETVAELAPSDGGDSPPPGDAAGPASSPAGPPEVVRAVRPPRFAVYLPGTALSLLSVLALGFASQVALLSHVRHERTQQTAYADFRADLARATAPVGQLDETTGRLYEPGTPVAVLEIPAIGLHEVVFEGTAGGVLESGPGHRRDTVFPGQAGTSVLMGRRASYGAPFRDLDLLSSGATVTVTTGQGVHSYRVLGVRRSGDLEPPPSTTGGRLVLVTAAGQPFLPDDVIQVDADLTTPAQPHGPRPLKGTALSASETALAGESEVWTPLLLWAQALTIAAFGVAWARVRWGRAQAWVVGVPVLTALGLTVADHLVRLLPNLL